MKKLKINKVAVIVCDFDGVLTDNKVYVDQRGREMVCCSRADGLAFDILKRMNIAAFILSTEKNPVVAARARKIGVPAIYGVANKLQVLRALAKKQEFSLDQVLYVGNDLNDLQAMEACAFRACPQDASREIKGIANIHLQTKGGEGVLREIVGHMRELQGPEKERRYRKGQHVGS